MMFPTCYERSTCPLCAGRADVQPTVVQRLIIRCPECGTFVVDYGFAEVVTNARNRGLAPILEHLPFLSGATRDADRDGLTMRLTATNWVGVAVRMRRVGALRQHQEVA